MIPNLNFDVYYKNDSNYTVYLTQRFSDETTVEPKNFLYKHRVNFESIRDKKLNKVQDLGNVCGDFIKATESVIVVACEATKTIQILERESMRSLGKKVDLDLDETFFHVEGIVRGSRYSSKSTHVISRTIQTFVYYVTYSSFT